MFWLRSNKYIELNYNVNNTQSDLDKLYYQ